VIKKKLVRKAIDMIKKLADAEVKAAKKGEEEKEEGEWGRGGGQAGGTGWGRRAGTVTASGFGQVMHSAQCEAHSIRSTTPVLAPHLYRRAAAAAPGAEAAAAEQSEEEKKKADEAAGAYAKFYAAFGKSLKMGIIEDSSNRWASVLTGAVPQLYRSGVLQRYCGWACRLRAVLLLQLLAAAVLSPAQAPKQDRPGRVPALQAPPAAAAALSHLQERRQAGLAGRLRGSHEGGAEADLLPRG
jgi:hypothetical protein